MQFIFISVDFVLGLFCDVCGLVSFCLILLLDLHIWLHYCTCWLHLRCLCHCTSLSLCLLVSRSGANTRIGAASGTGYNAVWQCFPYQTLLCLWWGTKRSPDSRAGQRLATQLHFSICLSYVCMYVLRHF